MIAGISAQNALAAESREAEMLLNADESTLVQLRPVPFGSDLLDRQAELDMRQRYVLMERRQELRDNSGLGNERGNMAERDGMRDELVSQVSQYQVNAQIRKAAGTGKNESALKSAKKPVVVVAAAAALYFGQPIPFRASESTSFRLQSEMRRNRAQLSMNSPVVGSSLDYNGSGMSDVAGAPDRARVSLTRGIPVLDLGSSVSYGSSSTVTTTVSKQLTREISVAVDSARRIQSPEAQQTVRMNYGLTF